MNVLKIRNLVSDLQSLIVTIVKLKFDALRFEKKRQKKIEQWLQTEQDSP